MIRVEAHHQDVETRPGHRWNGSPRQTVDVRVLDDVYRESKPPEAVYSVVGPYELLVSDELRRIDVATRDRDPVVADETGQGVDLARLGVVKELHEWSSVFERPAKGGTPVISRFIRQADSLPHRSPVDRQDRSWAVGVADVVVGVGDDQHLANA